MQPETTISNKIQTYLRSLGYQVLRVGRDGMPDIIAVHRLSYGKCWTHGSDYTKSFPTTERQHHMTFTRVVRLNPTVKPFKHGIFFFRPPDGSAVNFPNLFLEVKTATGEVSPRQTAVIKYLANLGVALFPTSVEDVESAIEKYLVEKKSQKVEK